MGVGQLLDLHHRLGFFKTQTPADLNLVRRQLFESNLVGVKRFLPVTVSGELFSLLDLSIDIVQRQFLFDLARSGKRRQAPAPTSTRAERTFALAASRTIDEQKRSVTALNGTVPALLELFS